MKITIPTNPYGEKRLYNRSNYELRPGLTVLIGRNGCGKSSFLLMVKEWCRKHKIEYFSYDNYTDGGSKMQSEYMFFNDFESLCNTAFHSEGEQIYYNLGKTMEKLGAKARKVPKDVPLVIMLDALDSGFDVDGIKQLKALVNVVMSDRGDNTYFLITANNYALVHKENCLDVRTGNYKTFSKFEEFEEFIEAQYQKDREKAEKSKRK